RVAGDVGVAAGPGADAAEPHGGAEVLDAPRDCDDARAGPGDLADAQQPLGRLRRDGKETGRPGRDPVTPLETIEELRDLHDVPSVARLGHDVAVGAPGDGFLEG